MILKLHSLVQESWYFLVAYTKGLEFDAVLLFDPSERKYPADDSHVKLLYVAATHCTS